MRERFCGKHPSDQKLAQRRFGASANASCDDYFVDDGISWHMLKVIVVATRNRKTSHCTHLIPDVGEPAAHFPLPARREREEAVPHRFALDYSAFPYPPAVGVWMISASPASITVASQPLSNSIEPSRRRTEFCPT